MHAPLDFFDPNSLDLEPRVCRIYADDGAQTYCELDDVDYWHFVRWRWCLKVDRWGKAYFRRAVSTYDLLGGRIGSATVYLHIEVMRRVRAQPTRRHCIVDHLDGDSFNNRRNNLRWATSSQNRRNYFGAAARQGALL